MSETTMEVVRRELIEYIKGSAIFRAYDDYQVAAFRWLASHYPNISLPDAVKLVTSIELPDRAVRGY